MAFSTYLADRILGWVRGTTFPAALSNVFISLHTGNPGDNGVNFDVTTQVTGSANRVGVGSGTFSSPATPGGGGRQITNNNVVQITTNAGVSAGTTQTVTHFGIWNSATGGDFLASGELTSSVAVQNGDTVQFNVGALAIRVI